MTALITFGAALLIVAASILVFLWLGPPVYRLEAVNVRALLILLLDEQATQSDWDVFAGVPIRHDPKLDEIRLRCCTIVAEQAVVKDRKLRLTAAGKQQIKQVLMELQEN